MKTIWYDKAGTIKATFRGKMPLGQAEKDKDWQSLITADSIPPFCYNIKDLQKGDSKKTAIAILANGGLGNDLIWLDAVYRLKKARHRKDKMIYFCRQYYEIFDDFDFVDFHPLGGVLNENAIGDFKNNYETVYDLRYVGRCFSDNPKLNSGAAWLKEYQKYYDDLFNVRSVTKKYHARELLARSLQLKYKKNYILPQPRLDKTGIPTIPRPFVIVANGTDPTQPLQTKSITQEQLKAICNAIMQSGYTVVEIGSDARGYSGLQNTINLIKKTTLKQAIKLLEQAITMVTCEGGMAHVSAWINKPAIVLFGPTPSSFWGYSIHTNIQSGLCEPCFLQTKFWHRACIKNKKCMAEFSIDYIINKIKQIRKR